MDMSYIEKVLDEKVRPELALHGGGIESLSFDDGIYRFRLSGQCSCCPSAYLTTENLIREQLLSNCKEMKEVVLVAQVSDDLLDQALHILRKNHG